MGESILKIEEIEGSRAGYSITTTDQIISMTIENEQCCCENWGYFLSEDNVSSFIGTNLLDITITDTALRTYKVNDWTTIYSDNPTRDMDYGGAVMFVNIHTDKGLLQFVAYNDHNGYYGHEASVVSKQLTENMYL